MAFKQQLTSKQNRHKNAGLEIRSQTMLSSRRWVSSTKRLARIRSKLCRPMPRVTLRPSRPPFAFRRIPVQRNFCPFAWNFSSNLSGKILSSSSRAFTALVELSRSGVLATTIPRFGSSANVRLVRACSALFYTISYIYIVWMCTFSHTLVFCSSREFPFASHFSLMAKLVSSSIPFAV